MIDRRALVEQALAEHNPRPVGDPLYVPYWAKGAVAEKYGYEYTLQDGTVVRSGKVSKMGVERLPEASTPAGLPQYRQEVQRASEVPSVARTTRSRADRPVAREPDRVAKMLQEHRTPEQRRALCERYGIDWTTIASAPNPGVGSMRLANALRKGLK